MKNKVFIRKYKNSDLIGCAKIISKTFKKFCSRDGTKEGIKHYIKTYSPSKNNLENIRQNFSKTPLFFVAIINKKVVGLIRGKKNRIGNFFVKGDYHGRGIGRKLVEKFESEAKKNDSKIIKISSSIYAIPIYQKWGYKKSTGIRIMHKRIKIQPMKKILK